ncbi:SAM-dependent methyltransferase [Thermocrinis sp.]
MRKNFYQFMKEKSIRYYMECEDIGRDFFTSPELDSIFGYSIGELIFKLIQDYKNPIILELGAGRGTLAYDILSFLKTNHPSFFERVKYFIYDFSPKLRGRQRQVLKAFEDKVDWVDELPSLSGFVLSNEFFDCFPVRLVRGDRELYLEDGKEIWLPLEDERVKQYMRRLNLNDANVVYEICLDCVDFLEKLSKSLEMGYILTVDYGYLEQPPFGTVMGYKGHRIVKNLYSEEVFDITASVNFKALMEYGKDFGLEVVFFKNQRDFLLLSDLFKRELKRLTESQEPEDIERLSRIKTMLISMGERFKVLLQKKCIL